MSYPDQAPQRAVTARWSQVTGKRGVGGQVYRMPGNPQNRHTVLDAASSTPIGAGRPTSFPIQNGQTYDMRRPNYYQGPSGAFGMFEGGALKRARVALGGNTTEQIRELGSNTLLGQGHLKPVLDYGYGRLNNMARQGAEGLAMMGGGIMAKPTISSGDIMPGSAVGSYPGKPTVFNGPGERNNGPRWLSATSSGDMFIQLVNGVPASINRDRNPLVTGSVADSAARQVQNNSKTGKPNARTQKTYRMSSQSAVYAQEEMARRIVIHPIDVELFDKEKVELEVGTPSGIEDLLDITLEPATHVFGLAMFNMLLANAQPIPRTLAQVKTAQEIFRSFRILGAVAAEEGHEFGRYGTNPEPSVARNLVVTVDGPVNTYNYWVGAGNDKQVGFILKGIPMDDVTAHHYRDVGTYNIEARNPDAVRVVDTQKKARCILQLIPWCDITGNNEAPDDSDLEYYDDAMRLKRGIWIPFGRIAQFIDKTDNDDNIDAAWRSAAAEKASGSVRVMLTRRPPRE